MRLKDRNEIFVSNFIFRSAVVFVPYYAAALVSLTIHGDPLQRKKLYWPPSGLRPTAYEFL
jgi:hypothetical protein